ncbi:SAM-dependent methyltransferase [Actinoplanes sp. NPDC049118]|uniref:SAM-dependent methyltransferase n=1 Tax=Actinoplanes sp. NPDC049118 TaxID=3155769 RepID=UPI0033F2C204
MSRGELADAVNAALDRLYPGQSSDLHVDYRWIGKLERGEHRWPCEERRAALKDVLDAGSDAELGLYNPRSADEATAFGMAAAKEPAVIDTTVPHPARRYNYWLGGKDHFAVDRESGDMIATAFPGVVTTAKENRAFLKRAVHFLAEAGIRQFLDIGTGLPAPDNTHEVAQRVVPDAHVVYVDNDPIVGVHARALTVGDERGRTAYLQADLRDPESILQHPAVAATLDLTEPVGLLLLAVLHFIEDDDQAADIVRRLTDALPDGSYLVLSHFTLDFNTAEEVAAYKRISDAGQADAYPRTRPVVARYLEGMQILDPGVVAVSEWRPDRGPDRRPTVAEVALCGAVAGLPIRRAS